MNPIQIVLITALILLVVVYFRLFRYRWVLRAAFGLLFAAGIVAVVFPELTTRIANRLGVTRGADLMLYGLVIVVGLSIAYFYGKLRQLEERQTAILRELTLLRGEEH